MPTPESCAGIVSRGVAFAVDAGIVLVACTVGAQFALGALDLVGAGRHVLTDGAVAVAYLISVPLVFAAYCAGGWTLIARTPGMALLGLRVVTATGAPPGARRAVIRAAGYWLSSIALLGFALIAVDKRAQGLHDKLAGTYVIYDWPS